MQLQKLSKKSKGYRFKVDMGIYCNTVLIQDNVISIIYVHYSLSTKPPKSKNKNESHSNIHILYIIPTFTRIIYRKEAEIIFEIKKTFLLNVVKI